MASPDTEEARKNPVQMLPTNVKLLFARSSEAHNPQTMREALWEQVLNSAIVGGIAGLSAFSIGDANTGWKTALIAFGLTFLIELRKYRLGGSKPPP